jgi:hypothetical protein
MKNATKYFAKESQKDCRELHKRQLRNGRDKGRVESSNVLVEENADTGSGLDVQRL